MLKHFQFVIAVAALTALLPRDARSGKVKIIANPSVKADSISAAELKSVFLEERSSLADGSRIEPVICEGGPTHESFVREYLGKSDADLHTYYRSLVFTGKGSTPKTVSSDTEIAAYVARTCGAIGCVSLETSTEGVKTLFVSDMENDGARRLIMPSCWEEIRFLASPQ